MVNISNVESVIMLNFISIKNLFNPWEKQASTLLQEWQQYNLEKRIIELPTDFDDPIPFRIELRITKNGQTIAGYGEGFNASEALYKAIGELQERDALKIANIRFKKISSNGIACHLFKNIAKDSAENELVERDSFFRHWLTKTPFTEISNQITDLSKSFNNSLKPHGYSLRIGYSTLGLKKTAIAVVQNKYGFALGCSRKANFKRAIDKACSEAVFNLMGFERNNLEINWKRDSLKNHRNYWLQNELPEWFFNSNSQLNRIQGLKKAKIQSYQIKTTPFPVYCSYSKDLYDLWAGKVPEHIEQDIYKKHGIFANSDPHPFP